MAEIPVTVVGPLDEIQDLVPEVMGDAWVVPGKLVRVVAVKGQACLVVSSADERVITVQLSVMELQGLVQAVLETLKVQRAQELVGPQMKEVP